MIRPLLCRVFGHDTERSYAGITTTGRTYRKTCTRCDYDVLVFEDDLDASWTATSEPIDLDGTPDYTLTIDETAPGPHMEFGPNSIGRDV